MQARILIVDDEESLVGLLQQALQLGLPGCQVTTADSGEAALSRLATEQYDLIIADLRMPGFDGLDLIKGVRYLDAHVPIVLMTGYGSAEIQQEARALGVNHYMDKPFDVDEFLIVAQRLLSRPAA